MDPPLYSCLCRQAPEELGRAEGSPCWITDSQDLWSLHQLSLGCTQVLAAGEALHSLVILVQHTPRDSSPLWEVSCLKEILIFFKLYLPWEREQPLRAHTPVCYLWVLPCSQGSAQLACKVFPDIFWKACSEKLAPALAPSSNLLGLLPLLSFRAGVLLTTRSLKEPGVLPGGSSAWLPTMSPGCWQQSF